MTRRPPAISGLWLTTTLGLPVLCGVAEASCGGDATVAAGGTAPPVVGGNSGANALGGTSSSGGATSGTSGGGGGSTTTSTGEPCSSGDCNVCVMGGCAATHCSEALAACDGEPDCVGLEDCMWGCGGNGLCAKECQQLYPDGVELFVAKYDCLTCEACAADCHDLCDE